MVALLQSLTDLALLLVFPRRSRHGRVPGRDLPIGLFLANSVSLLNLAHQALVITAHDLDVVIGELAPLLADRPFELIPLAFCLLPIHLLSPPCIQGTKHL